MHSLGWMTNEFQCLVGNLRLEQKHQKNSHQSCLAWANFADLSTHCAARGAVWFASHGFAGSLKRCVGAMGGWKSDNCKICKGQKNLSQAKHSRTDCLKHLTASCETSVNSWAEVGQSHWFHWFRWLYSFWFIYFILFHCSTRRAGTRTERVSATSLQSPIQGTGQRIRFQYRILEPMATHGQHGIGIW